MVVTFRFAMFLLPAPGVYDLWTVDSDYEELETWKIPYMPFDYLFLSLTSLVKVSKELGLPAVTDIQITGHLLILFIGLGTFGRAIWISIHNGDALFALMRKIWRFLRGG
jgi:hypothetical protein